MSDIMRSMNARRVVVAFACALLVGVSAVASAQTVVPATACDAALANPDLHPQPETPLENGTIAFSYNAEGPFVSGGGAFLSINVALTFPPGPNTTIRISAIDDACTGANGFATVFTFTFDELTSTRNTMTYDAGASLLVFNGTVERATPQGNARYLFVDVWDGELPSTHASHSYMIDLLNPANPTTP